MLSRIRTFTSLLTAVFAVAVLSGAAPPPPTLTGAPVAKAAPARILLHFKFYSSSARTSLVGEAYEYCDGTYEVIWGVETEYKTVYSFYCPE